jgi:hypothetical protein
MIGCDARYTSKILWGDSGAIWPVETGNDASSNRIGWVVNTIGMVWVAAITARTPEVAAD